MKRILVWLGVFLLIPILFGAFVYFLQSKQTYKKIDASLVDTGKEALKSITPDISSQKNYNPENLAGVDFKVPLFDTIILPLASEFSFNYEGKEYKGRQIGEVISSGETSIFPVSVTQEKMGTYSFLTTFTQIGKIIKQGQSVFLGDQVTLSEISLTGGVLSVVIEEKAGDTMKKYFSLESGQIAPYYPSIMKGNVSADFISQKWIWKKTTNDTKTEIVPKKEGDFTISFDQDGNLTADTDCNKIIGRFVLDKDAISISELATTRMSCEEGSQEEYFVSLIKSSKTFVLSEGSLILSGSGFTSQFTSQK